MVRCYAGSQKGGATPFPNQSLKHLDSIAIGNVPELVEPGTANLLVEGSQSVADRKSSIAVEEMGKKSAFEEIKKTATINEIFDVKN